MSLFTQIIAPATPIFPAYHRFSVSLTGLMPCHDERCHADVVLLMRADARYATRLMMPRLSHGVPDIFLPLIFDHDAFSFVLRY